MSLLRTDGVFIRHKPLHISDLNYINQFRYDKNCQSNYSNYNARIDLIIGNKSMRKYKDKKERKTYYNRKTGEPTKKFEGTYNNIIGHRLKILLPTPLHKEENKQLKDFVNKVMLSIDPRFKKLDYIWQCKQKGMGIYIYVICFTRYVYDRPIKRPIKYKKNTYNNKLTGQTCSKDDPLSVQTTKKGDFKLDKNGNKTYETLHIKKKEEVIFKARNIKTLNKKLQKDLAYAIMIFTRSVDLNYKRIIKKQIPEKTTIAKRIKINCYNRKIDLLNAKLTDIQTWLKYVIADEQDYYWRQFDKLYYKIAISLKHYSINLKSNLSLDIDFSVRYIRFKDMINFFFQEIENWIDEYEQHIEYISLNTLNEIKYNII